MKAPSQTTFRVWASHGDFEPSEDCQAIFFSENGPDGLVLKRGSLVDGSVSIVARNIDAQRIAIIPGDKSRVVIAWQAGNGASPPYSMAIVNLESGVSLLLGVGESGGDDRLFVSPSGQSLATGVDVRPEGRGWSPRGIGVFSLRTGKREFAYKIPGFPQPATLVNWTTDDKLVVTQGGTDVAFRRLPNGFWAKMPIGNASFARFRAVQRNIYRSEPLRFQRFRDERTVEVAPLALFHVGVETSIKHAFSSADSAVAVQERFISEKGWKEVDVVVLRWKSETEGQR